LQRCGRKLQTRAEPGLTTPTDQEKREGGRRFPLARIIEAIFTRPAARHARPAASLAAGALLPFGLAPYDLWPLTLVSAAGLYWVLTRGSARPLLDGWLFGVGKYGLGASWIYVSINVYGDAAPPLAGFLVAVFVAGMALFHAAAAWLFVRLRPRNATVDAVWFATVWVLLEWLLTWFLTGFPWLFAGYAMLDTPLEVLAPVGGVLLVSFAAVLTAACLVSGRSWISWTVAAVPWIAAWLMAGIAWTGPGQAHRVALVQGDIPQEIKWQPDAGMTFDRYASLSAPFWDRDLVVWSEAVLYAGTGAAREFLAAMSARAEGALLLGVATREEEPGSATYYNAAMATGAGSGLYRKQRLVPFGDYVPFQGVLRGLIGFFDLPMSSLSPGESGQPPLRGANGIALGMAICYEIAYPELVREQAKGADALVTISNDTWFGESIGPLQHMQIARMRALENGRYVLRATNNGVTAIVDGRGRITAALPQFEPGVLAGEFHRMSGTTPFARLGSMLVVTPLILFLAAVVGGRVAARFSSNGNAP
ncbi:MAG: apolipoprotein N-acyltransferase, partial [Gammaproteobacteria bacterium]|nr:apolipoprotein N-acyltransferase [Gammaproteobacteria bacterium]